MSGGGRGRGGAGGGEEEEGKEEVSRGRKVIKTNKWDKLCTVFMQENTF